MNGLIVTGDQVITSGKHTDKGYFAARKLHNIDKNAKFKLKNYKIQQIYKNQIRHCRNYNIHHILSV